MAYEFVYESEAKRYRSDCSDVLKETCELLKEKGISAQFSLVGYSVLRHRCNYS